MTLTDDELEQIREIVRQELRRELGGVQCPACGEAVPASEFDEYVGEGVETLACPCGFEAHPAEYENATP